MALKDKKTSITFHSGMMSIGGTVVEVAYENDRIFFDFGTEYKPELNLKDESIASLIEHNLIPKLDHMYVGDSIDPNKNTAVFLSHVHLDHTRMINYLNPEVPLYALKETKLLLENLNKNNDFLLPLSDTSNGYTRKIIGCDHESIVHVGDISVQLLRVDHDAYGACGLWIQTPDLKVAYTGDLRLHGFDAQDTYHYIDTVKHCDVLIIEGVTVSFEPETTTEVDDEIKTEQELIDRFVAIQNEFSDKQITFNAYPANVKRLVEINKQSPRRVVFTEPFAYILKETVGLDVYYYNHDHEDFSLDSDYKISYDELLEDTNKYLWQIDKDYEKLKGGGVYIHSNAVPLGEFDPAYGPFIEALILSEVAFYEVKCSGHAYPEDLDKIIDGIKPKLLVPIHSLRPERLENPHGERYLPIRGKTI